MAHHGGPDTGVRRRGLDAFANDAGPTRDALWFCDAAVGPVDPDATPQDDDDVVVIQRRAAVERTRARLDAQT